MTEERKRELRRLLEEARGSLEVCQEYGGRFGRCCGNWGLAGGSF
ncbi:MAG: hypothetical protein OXN17_08055 [Candidatus Poribacteria bacterium]|nr:hypothetical protein [Candidatus Poribacteria bacterium]